MEKLQKHNTERCSLCHCAIHDLRYFSIFPVLGKSYRTLSIPDAVKLHGKIVYNGCENDAGRQKITHPLRLLLPHAKLKMSV